MMTRERAENRAQMEIISLEDMVPENHLVRKLEAAIDWNFIYDLVEPLYCEDNGRPSLDPVTLIKLPILQYMFGIRSMRQTVAEAEVNTAYRWFLGLGLQDKVPHFSTFSKNYTRRFKDTDLFEQIFQRILRECMEEGLVDPSVAFVDSTHVKARDNGNLVGFHIHPMFFFKGWEDEYKYVIDEITSRFKPEELLMIGIGTLTFTKAVIKRLREMGAESKVLEMELVEAAGKYS